MKILWMKKNVVEFVSKKWQNKLVNAVVVQKLFAMFVT